MSRINFLPPWVETNEQPAFYDKESGTVLQQTARMYAKVNQLVRSVNEQNETIADYIQQFIDLKDYCEDYFANLDVQAEINAKLDQMAEDGELGNLIGAYITPLQEAYEAEINAQIAGQNDRIDNINTKVEAVTNNSPIPVGSTGDMTDTTKVYVLTTTGKWYYYDGDSWEIGGDYQTPVATFDTTLTASNGVAESKSIGDRINRNFYVNNLIDHSNSQEGKKLNASGEVVNDNSRVIYNTVIPVKDGDTLFSEQITSGTTATQILLGDIAKVDCYGNFIEFLNYENNITRFTFTSDCFIKIIGRKPESGSFSDAFYYLNYPEYDYQESSYQDKHSEEIEEIKDNLELNGVQYNYLNVDKCINNQNLDGNGSLIFTTAGWSVSNLIPVKSGDVVRFYNFNLSGTYQLNQIWKYNTNKQPIARVTVLDNSYTADFNGYIKCNIKKPTSADSLGDCDISINRELDKHYPYGIVFSPINDKKVSIEKVNSTNYLIRFGNFNVTLFKTENEGANANNWNLKTVKRGDNVLVPEGTDIIGPVRINDNSDFIGGVHGDEITQHIIINIDGDIYKDSDISNITSAVCERITISLYSDVYDQIAGDLAFERNVIINITEGKINCSNSYKAKKNLTLKTACVGGLIACKNTIVSDIIMNSDYYNSAPTTEPYNYEKANTSAVINTSYGSIQVNNIKGYENPNYIGYLKVYTNETPMRCKVYFNPYHNGSYPITSGDIIAGEFEYLFN